VEPEAAAVAPSQILRSAVASYDMLDSSRTYKPPSLSHRHRMQRDPVPQQEGTGRILRFRSRTPAGSGVPHLPQGGILSSPGRSPVEGIGKYERPGADIDDYRHRMTMNALAFAVLLLLIAGGLWLAIKIAELRRDQDCVLTGRRNCAQISITGPSER
jgi:hypothetical protein